MGVWEQAEGRRTKSQEKYANHCKSGKNKSALSYLTPLHCFIKEYSCNSKTWENKVRLY